MVAIVFLSLFFLFNTILSTTIDLNLQNTEKLDNRNIAYLGQTFQVRATVNDANRSGSDLKILGLDKLNILRKTEFESAGFHNKQMFLQREYVFDVSGKNEGLLKIGPAYIEQNGKRIESNTVVVELKKNDLNRDIKLGDSSSVFCELKIDSNDVFVGQPIILSLSVYTSGNILQIDLSAPKFQGFLVNEIEQISKYQEKINGRIFNVIKKKYLLFPINNGLHKIDPFRVDFTIPVRRSMPKGFFDDDFMFRFGLSDVEQKRAFSNDLKIDVKPLPKIDKLVYAVGQFNRFDISVDRYEAKVNEPISLKLEIEGKGNLKQINYPKLEIPTFFKVYNSKVELKQDLRKDYNGGRKVFEYVLQVGRDGSFKIPPQKLIYFDTASRTYKTLETKEIELKIDPCNDQEDSVVKMDSGNYANDDKMHSQEEKEIANDINFIIEDNIEKAGGLELPFWFFLVLFCIPILIFFRKGLIDFCNAIKFKYFSSFSRRSLFTKFSKKLDQIVIKNKVEKLYKFYIDFFAINFSVPINMVTQDFIEKRLYLSNFPEDKIEDFLDYLNLCASYHFSSRKDDVKVKKYLLDKSKYWFLLLKNNLGISK